MATKGKRVWMAFVTTLLVARGAFGFVPGHAAHSLRASAPPRDNCPASKLDTVLPVDGSSITVQYLPGTDLPTSITGGGKTWTCQYYPNGLPRHVSASGSPDADYTWDTMGRLCSMTLTPSAGACSTTTWERDPQSGRLTCKKVNGAVIETYAWRANGQPDTVVRPTGTIQNQYNAAGDPTALVDTPANYAAETVTTAYDRPGNVVANAVVGGIAEAYTNYIDGTLLGVQVSGNGVVPDHANAWPLNFATGQALGYILTQGGTVRNLAVFYNAASCVTNIVDGMVASAYSWTPGGSATNITWTVAGVPCLTLQNGWNEALGVRTNMAYFVNGVPLASFAFSRGPGTNQITKITREDGSTRAVTYDNSGRLAGWKYKNSAGVADYDRSWLYSYDGAGNLLSSGHDPSVAGGPVQMSPMAKDYATKNIRTTSQFDVDAFNFHTIRRWNAVDLVCFAAANARVTVNGMPARQNGTRFVISIPLAPSTTASVTNLTVCAVLDGGTNAEYYYTNTVQMTLPAYPETIETALASAVTSDSVMEYLYDARGQLRRVTDKDGATAQRLQTTNDYYPDRRRARKTVTIWDGSAWQPYRICQYIYDRWNLIREIITENGNTTTRDYTWGLDLAGIQDGQWGQDAGGIGGLLAITEVTTENQEPGTTNIFLPICDCVGTVHALVAAMTNSVPCVPFVAATYEYTPYGELIAQDGPYANSCPFLFQSKYRDCETGLVYFGKRYYQSPTWLTADPLGEAGGLNLTVAFADDPVNNTDPDGMEIGTYEESGLVPRGYSPYYYGTTIPEVFFANVANLGSLINNTAHNLLRNLDVLGDRTGFNNIVLALPLTAPIARAPRALLELEELAQAEQTLNKVSKLERAAAELVPLVRAPAAAKLPEVVSAAANAAADAKMIQQREEASRIFAQIISEGQALHNRWTEFEKTLNSQWWSKMTFVKPAGEESFVWSKTAMQRGIDIEGTLAKTEYSGWFRVGAESRGKFPLVDFQQGNNLVSLKTVDTAGKTWLARMQSHIRSLGTQGAEVGGNPANMVLDLRVQPGGLNAAISLIDYGRQNGVTVIIKEFP